MATIRIAIDARKLEDGGIGRYVREILARAPGEMPEASFSAIVPEGKVDRLRSLAPAVAPIARARLTEAKRIGASALAELRSSRCRRTAFITVCSRPSRDRWVPPAANCAIN